MAGRQPATSVQVAAGSTRAIRSRSSWRWSGSSCGVPAAADRARPVLVWRSLVLAAHHRPWPAVVRTPADPGRARASILVVNAFFYPGATDCSSPRAARGHARGPGFGMVSAGTAARGVPRRRSCSSSRPSPTTCSRPCRPRREPPDRVRRAVGGPDGAAAAGIARRRSSRPSRPAASRSGGSFVRRVRALVPLVGPVLLGSLIDVRERTFALEARGFSGRARDGPRTGSSRTHASTDRGRGPPSSLPCQPSSPGPSWLGPRNAIVGGR